MSKAFIYGKMVEGENFTDRIKETKRLKANFEEGLNTIVISPRRIGKSSLMKRVKDSIDNPNLKVVMMGKLNELIHKTLPEDCGCIELEENEIEITKTDSQIRNEILLLSECLTIAEFQRLDIKRRKQIISKLKRQGAGARQLARITGMSLSTISRCNEKEEIGDIGSCCNKSRR